MKKMMSRYAIASFVFSLLSMILGPFGFIPGIICGHIARREIQRDDLNGLGLANTGLAFGYGFLFVALIAVYLFYNTKGTAWPALPP
jgi:hypothetical protein